ncbi:MAG TPA: hypothetical protein VN893_25445 [Bryobacteraceae bacterium]|nr:hypothetical protein [Bryobacteraceae bacterium]
MPALDGSKAILAASAGYHAGDWADVEAQGSLDFEAVADFSRGIDLQIGAEALVQLDGSIRQYLAADLAGQANAAARVQAQVQVPLDLFNEAGVAIRLQAVAEAAASATLAIGLDAGDFLQLAGSDPHLGGVPLELLKAFLAEFTIQGGVMAKAAASAMAYANLALTGRLVANGTDKPGFTVAGEAGVGLEAGAGFRVLARFGVDDPRRWLRRSVDIAVDGSIAAVAPELPGPASVVLRQCRVPVKIALRTAFEVGEALAANQGAFSPDDGPRLALRCVQAGLEEIQRHVLESAVAFALSEIRAVLRALGAANPQRWQAAHPQRQQVADRLHALPDYPFEVDAAGLAYWLGLIDDVTQLAQAVAPGNALAPGLLRPLSIVWCAIQLVSVALQRISSGQARLAIIGMSPIQTAPAFDGDLPAPADSIRSHINSTLGRAASAAIGQSDAVAFLIECLVNALDQLDPSVSDALQFVAGSNATGLAEGLSLVLSNIGAFATGGDGDPSSTASLQVLRSALVQFFNVQVDATLRPALLGLSGDSRDAALFVDEALIGSLRAVTGDLFDRLLAWSQGDDISQRTLREFCSNVIMTLAGRSLVVAGDVLLTKALEAIQAELRALANHVADANGVAAVLSQLTGLDRDFVTEVIQETLLVAADAFQPMPAEKRARVRELLYEIMAAAQAADLSDLANAGFVPGLDSAQELALLLGDEIAGNFIRFVQALLLRVGGLILDDLRKHIDVLQQSVERWLQGLAQLAGDLAQRLAQLAGEMEALGRDLEDATDQLLARLSDLLGRLGSDSGSRAALRSAVKDLATQEALGALRSIGIYQALPGELRVLARAELGAVVGSVLNTGLFDPAIQAIATLSGATAGFLNDVRAINPGDDLEQAVLDLFLDRIEDAVRNAFGDRDPSLTLAIDFAGIHISLGSVAIPLAGVISQIRGAVRGLQAIQDLAHAVAQALADVFLKEGKLRAAEEENDVVETQQESVAAGLAQTRRGPPAIEILQPTPGAVLDGVVHVEIALHNVAVSILDASPPAIQRVYLWINQDSVPLSSAQATPLAPASANANAVAGLHPRSLQKAKLLDSSARQSVGTITKAGGRTLPVQPGSDLGASVGRRLRPSELAVARQTGDEGISLQFDAPESLFQDGINTIAVAVLPGSQAQRVEQVAAFLWRRQGKAEIPAPAQPVWNVGKLPPSLAELVRTRPSAFPVAGGGQPLDSGAGLAWASSEDKHGTVHQAGFATARVRRAGLGASMKQLSQRASQSIEEIGRVRAAVSGGLLRPAVAGAAPPAPGEGPWPKPA